MVSHKIRQDGNWKWSAGYKNYESLNILEPIFLETDNFWIKSYVKYSL